MIKFALTALLTGSILVLLAADASFASQHNSRHRRHHRSHRDSSAYNVQNSLPSGYVTDGSVDYTSFVQSAISQHSNIVFPGFPIMVSDVGLNIGSNKTLTFSNGSKIILKGTSKPGYYILMIKHVSNVTLNNVVIVGDRSTHTGKGGEWGMGIGIVSSSNIVLNAPKISDCWGDGIYLGEDGTPNTNITIANANINNVRRNGISVISVDGLKIISPYIANANGAAPMSGIDLEPNNSNEEMKNVQISDAVTENNKGEGILMFLDRLYGDNDKNVSVNITNHKDKGSSSGFRVICNKLKPANGKITGSITTSNPEWKQNTRKPLDAVDIVEPNLRVLVSNPTVDNKGKAVRSDTAARFMKRSVNPKGNLQIQ